MDETLQDLINAIDGTNIESLHYSTITDMWTIYHNDGLSPDIVSTENLVYFIDNA